MSMSEVNAKGCLRITKLVAVRLPYHSGHLASTLQMLAPKSHGVLQERKGGVFDDSLSCLPVLDFPTSKIVAMSMILEIFEAQEADTNLSQHSMRVLHAELPRPSQGGLGLPLGSPLNKEELSDGLVEERDEGLVCRLNHHKLERIAVESDALECLEDGAQGGTASDYRGRWYSSVFGFWSIMKTYCFQCHPPACQNTRGLPSNWQSHALAQ